MGKQMRRERLGQNMIQLRAKSLHLELLRTKMILELFSETHLDPQLLHSRSEARRFVLCPWYRGPLCT